MASNDLNEFATNELSSSTPFDSADAFRLPDALASFSKLPAIDAFTSFSKLPAIDTFATLSKLPSTDALDFLNQTPPVVPPPPPPPSAAQHVVPNEEEEEDQSMFSMPSPVNVTAVPSLSVTPTIRKVRRGRNVGSPVTQHVASCAVTDSEAKRRRHNQMMRENRERTNRKFAALEALLQRCACANVACSRPMRNKMQVLDRAMAQYPAMRARRALLRAQLVLAEPKTELNMPGATADTLARLLLAAQGWKAAEIWDLEGTQLMSALVAPKNMWATANRIRGFVGSVVGATDGMVQKARRIGGPLWIPDLRTTKSRRAEMARRARVSTALYVPLNEAVIVLYHADDELLTLNGAVRRYDADALARVEQLAKALHLVPS